MQHTGTLSPGSRRPETNHKINYRILTDVNMLAKCKQTGTEVKMQSDFAMCPRTISEGYNKHNTGSMPQRSKCQHRYNAPSNYHRGHCGCNMLITPDRSGGHDAFRLHDTGRLSLSPQNKFG
eukprot:CAMPEP_0203915718 /NCGR_PEP_ID=MMETSP0359-20131031/56494_1 /ASSEMBLY_ACC=CAM_ASM_000338 /TAXON_ID=268821 /ORGANISM="Scrippsiella Hangoei, Strain SHTV-5" /LENGTH=121 /DNA_ID=CAMNT_0050842277 /DNA_START=54 /DNA_END=416 /DNA_ORIENTATION=-